MFELSCLPSFLCVCVEGQMILSGMYGSKGSNDSIRTQFLREHGHFLA